MSNALLRRCSITIAVVLSAVLLLPATTAAQLNASNLKGDAGLKSGSQAPPGAYVAIQTRVGNILNFEGGIGADVLKGGLTASLPYFGVFKLTDDQFESRLAARLLDKNRVWGLGPAVTLALATKSAVYAFVTVGYQWELAARTSTEGAVWNIAATFPLKPIRLAA